MNASYVIVRVDGVQHYEHRLLAEKALGRALRKGEEVHHLDGNTKNNTPGNLVVCDRTTHRLLERRAKALAACGNADWRLCQYCKTWDAPENLYFRSGDQKGARHRHCHAEAERRRKLQHD